jgi:ethanolamine utilization protein EutM
MSSKALGLIETIGLSAAIEAADAAAKSANITLLGYENSNGGGMITVKIMGDVGAVKAAVSAGVAAAQRVGKVASSHIIPRPNPEIEPLIQNMTRGKGAKSSEPAAKPAPKSKPKTSSRAAKPKAAATSKKSQPKPKAKPQPDSSQPDQPQSQTPPDQPADTPPSKSDDAPAG